jgi:hypothetical protein
MTPSCPNCGQPLTHEIQYDREGHTIVLECYRCEACAASLPCSKARREE